MKYFIPEWDDKVDPSYNFLTDTHSSDHKLDPTSHDVYMWEIFGIDKVPCDGLLVSIATLEGNTKKFSAIKENGIHRFLRLPRSFPLMADCGAFSYIKKEIPPYKTQDVLRLYCDLGFQYGVSIDHLVVPQFLDQKEARLRTTYINGVEAFNLWKKEYRDDFQLIVAVQGETIPEYLDMFENFSLRGITHFGFGGLVRSPTNFIISLIDAIIDKVPKLRNPPEHIHFFGVARCQLLSKYKELETKGIEVSFDSASYLRKAWLSTASSESNYLTPDLSGYSAIRIPLSRTRTKSNKDQEYEEISKKCLHHLRQYENGNLSLEGVLKSLAELNTITHTPPHFLDYYRRTLVDKPWLKCSCPICQKHGIEVVIFRGNNRNRRRGFHNTYVFYNLLHDPNRWTVLCEDAPVPTGVKAITSLEKLKRGKKILLIVGCTKKKLADTQGICAPAKDMYQGILFKKIREYAEAMGFPYLIISAKYGLVTPDQEICGYNKVLKTRKDVESIRPGVEKALEPYIDKFDTICLIAGDQYRSVVRNMMNKKWCYLKARGIGDMISIVSRAIPRKDHTLDEFFNKEKKMI